MIDLSQGDLCGGYTHELIYESGPMLDPNFGSSAADFSPFSLIELSVTRVDMKGAVQDFSWLGAHTIYIKSTNGAKDLSVTARGDQGLFRSVSSQTLVINIINPCLTSVVNGDGNLILEDMVVPNGQTLLDLTYNGPTDSASVTYGNGYDKCGNLTYIWFDD